MTRFLAHTLVTTGLLSQSEFYHARDFALTNLERLLEDSSNSDWSPIYNCPSAAADVMVEQFDYIIRTLIDRHTPFHSHRKKIGA